MIGRLKDLFTGRNGEWVISISTPSDPRGLFDKLHDEDIDVEIKKHRNKRSLDANNFAWVLIDKIAAEMGLKKTEVYLKEIKEIGGITTNVAVKEDFVDSYIEAWKCGHIGRDAWVVPAREEKPGWKVVKVRLGSSDFDTLQMHTLITNLIMEAESLGIPTITEEEEQRMIGDWGKKRKENEKDVQE